jgi:hypothetical protein
MSTRNLPGVKSDNLSAICVSIVYKMWEPRRLKTLCASTACLRDSFTFIIVYVYDKNINVFEVVFIAYITLFVMGVKTG